MLVLLARLEGCGEEEEEEGEDPLPPRRLLPTLWNEWHLAEVEVEVEEEERRQGKAKSSARKDLGVEEEGGVR